MSPQNIDFTYGGDPDNNDVDAVRFEVGDTAIERPLVRDNEIKYALQKEGSVLRAAARIADHLAARFAREGTIRVSSVTNEKIDVSKEYRELAKALRQRAITASSFVIPSISKDAKRANETDTDIVQPSMKRGMHTHRDTLLSTD